MISKSSLLTILALIWIGSGCADGARSAASESERSQPIKDGTEAIAYPEAVTMNVCSGVVIAPSVVMTAAHCIGEAMGIRQGNYTVNAPHAGNQSAHGSSAWGVGYVTGLAKHMDVALVFLDSPITLACYPALQGTELSFPTQVVDLGRTLNGDLSGDLWVSEAISINGTGDAFGLDDHYASASDLTEDGDSGGPIELADGSHTVVAVTSTDTIELGLDAGAPTDLFARVDLEWADIDAMVKTHGGYGAVTCGASGAGGTSGAGGASGTSAVSGGGAGGASVVTPPSSGSDDSSSGGGCSIPPRPRPSPSFGLALLAFALLRRTSRARAKISPASTEAHPRDAFRSHFFE